jgi:glycosyltransferase involved in cell wall biosynthesis
VHESPAGSRIGLLVAQSTTQADGIRDYTRMLLQTLRRSALEAELFEWANGGTLSAISNGGTPVDLEALDALVVQYNPFSFGRWGFAPQLPLFLARLRRRRPRPLVAVMFHETYVDMRNLRWALMGSWQRSQLLAMQAVADVQFCSIQRWTERLLRTSPGRPVHHLPVASNLPDARSQRGRGRALLGVDADTIVLSCMGLRHPGRLEEHVLAAAREAGAVAPSVLLLDLGPGEQSDQRLAANVRLLSTGFLEVDELACYLAASDVFLAPYMDGVSTRRTTVMAALAHGVPVVGTAGHLTDDVLRHAPGLALVEVGAPERFADTTSRLVRDAEQRVELGAAGRRLYETSFDWPVLAGRLRAHLHV